MNGGRFLRIISFLAACLILGCNYARMNDQEAIKTYKEAVPEMPGGVIPASGGIEILKKANPKDLKNPMPLSLESIDRGKTAYEYFCIQCHGPRADGRGTVGQSFSPLPTNLKDRQVQAQSDGEILVKILLGFKRHPPLATTVSEEDTWAVVNYIRSLKKKG